MEFTPPPTLPVVSVVAAASFTEFAYSRRNAAAWVVAKYATARCGAGSIRNYLAGLHVRRAREHLQHGMAPARPPASRQGRRFRRTARTAPLPSRKTTSMENAGNTCGPSCTEPAAVRHREAADAELQPGQPRPKTIGDFQPGDDGLAGRFTQQTPGAGHLSGNSLPA